MQITRIKTLDEFIKKISEPSCHHYVYRGVSDAKNHKLIPTIGRLQIAPVMGIDEIADLEDEYLNDFKLKSHGRLNVLPKNDWEWLALAQHHQLPTRLLDWTSSPLIAAYFATKPRLASDGTIIPCNKNGVAIYAMHVCEYYDYRKVESPMEVSEHIIFYPPHISGRISGQAGLFSLQPDPRKEFNIGFENKDENTIEKIILEPQICEGVKNLLYQWGIRQGILFPDLDGFAADIKIKHQMGDCHYKHTRYRNDAFVGMVNT